MMPGTVYHCECPAGHGSHQHDECPVVQRWLTLACWGEGGIAGVRWLAQHPLGHPMLLSITVPVRDGGLWCPRQALEQSPLPVGVFFCLDGWVRTVLEEERHA